MLSYIYKYRHRLLILLLGVFLVLTFVGYRKVSKAHRKRLAVDHPLPKHLEYNPSAITYTFSGGRFGDNLIAYLHAKWLSHKYQLPLLYKPFPLSAELALHNIEHPYNAEDEKKFKNIVVVKSENDLLGQDKNSTLFVVHYFPDNSVYHTYPERFPYFKVNWHDQEFRDDIVGLIKSIKSLHEHNLPKDRLTVAVHMRKGGGFDQANANETMPLKFPPDSFYIEQIERIYSMFKEQPLYVFLFTDDKNPGELLSKYEHALSNPNIELHCRKDVNGHQINVLDDFFALTQYDCLIRADSNFSVVAEKIADYKVVISPASSYWDGDDLIVDQVTITEKKR